MDIIQKRLGYSISTRAFIPVLVPMFLIISSSVYPAIISSIENKEIQIISEAAAELAAGRNVIDSGRYHAHMQEFRSNIATQSSPIPTPTPTPIAPTITSKEPTMMQSQSKDDDDMMQVTSIDSGKAVHTIWSDDTPGNREIFYKRAGADFDPTTVNLSNNPGFSVNPKVAISGNNVHAVWDDETSGNFEILYRRSFDGGATFGPTINLSNNLAQSTRPAIAVSGNNVYVVWDDDTPGNFDILYKRSTDGGASFNEPTKNLSGNVGISFQAAISTSGSNVHVVWQDDTQGNGDVFYRRSTDSGATFPNIIKNLSGNAGISRAPEIATSGSTVHVVWRDDTSGNGDVFYRRSTDSGATFPNIIKNLSGNIDISSDPVIAVSGNNVHVIWVETPGIFSPGDIKYRRSLDNGTTFPNIIKNLSSSSGFSTNPAIALSSNNIYVTWSDDTNSPGASEVLYRTSGNNGDTFSSLLTNLSTNSGGSSTPSVAAS